MTVEGSLDQFSLAEILHLLEYAAKTGELAVSSAGRVGVVRVAGGRLAAATPDSTRFGLARRLVGSGYVGDADLASAAGLGADEPALLDALVALGAIGSETLDAARREQLLDALFDLMRRPAGTFSFTAAAVPSGPDLAMDDVVSQVRHRLTAYDGDAELMPPADDTVALARTVAEDAVLHPGEWVLLPLLDGERTIAELADLTGRGEYAVARAVAALLARGLAVTRTGAPTAADLARRAEVLRRLEGGLAAPEPPAASSPQALPPVADPAGAPNPAPAAAPELAALMLLRQAVLSR